MNVRVFGASAFIVAFLFEVADVVQQDGDQPLAEGLVADLGVGVGELPIEQQGDETQRRLHGMFNVMVGGIHGLETVIVAGEHVRDGGEELGDVGTLSTRKHFLLIVLHQVADLRGS